MWLRNSDVCKCRVGFQYVILGKYTCDSRTLSGHNLVLIRSKCEDNITCKTEGMGWDPSTWHAGNGGGREILWDKNKNRYREAEPLRPPVPGIPKPAGPDM